MRILLVEDEDLLAEFLKRSLIKSGHSVDCASDGLIASEKINSKTYDVIILDIILPRKNGLDVCRDARRQKVKTPILILSSQDAETSRIQGLDAGADDYMIKPFSTKELEARLRALHRRLPQIVSEEIPIGHVIFNATTRRVSLDGKEVELRSKEFALLEFLVRNENRVVPREEIFINVWGVSAENASNRVDACVKELRTKLGKNIIRTAHGIGYAIFDGTRL